MKVIYSNKDLGNSGIEHIQRKEKETTNIFSEETCFAGFE